MNEVNPTFFVIGAYRSGTTTLYRMMRQHPDIFLPLEKEPNFFAVDGNPHASKVLRSRSVADRGEYEALYEQCAPTQRSGDISPEYLRNPYVAAHLADTVPEARLVAVLRNPIERAWSDFLLHRRDGNEPCESLPDALAAQAERQAGDDHRAGHYIDTGMYSTQLQRYFDVFPRDQIKVYLFEDLRTDLDLTMAAIFSHVGVDDSFAVTEEAPINASGVPRNAVVAAVLKARGKLRPFVSRSVLERVRPLWDRVISKQLDRPQFSAQDRALLTDIYRDEIESLAAMLDRDLSHWLTTPGSPPSTDRGG